LHQFSVALNGELEMEGEEEKVPNYVHSNRDGRQALREGMVLGNLLYHTQNCEKGCDYHYGRHAGVVGDVCHVFGLTGLLQAHVNSLWKL